VEPSAEATSADGELNIVPFLDVVVNLIMFLLMTVTATLALAEVPASVPDTTPPGARPASPPPPLVHLAADGIHVFAGEQRMAPGCAAPGDGGEVTVPRVGGGQDWLGLRSCSVVLSQRRPSDARVDLSASADAPYEDIIHAMDALRGPAGSPHFTDVRWVAPQTAR